MKPILALRHAACEGLSQINDPDIRAAIVVLIAACDDVLIPQRR